MTFSCYVHEDEGNPFTSKVVKEMRERLENELPNHEFGAVELSVKTVEVESPSTL